MPSASKAPPEPSTPEPAPAPAGAAQRSPASVAASGKADKPSGAEPAAEPAKGAAVQNPQSSDGLQASEPVKTLPGDSISFSAAQTSGTPRKEANGQATPEKNPAKPVETAPGVTPPSTISPAGGKGGSKGQPAVESPAKTGKKVAQPQQKESGKATEGKGVEQSPRSRGGKAAEASPAAAASALSPAKIRIKQPGQPEAETGTPKDTQAQKAGSNSKVSIHQYCFEIRACLLVSPVLHQALRTCGLGRISVLLKGHGVGSSLHVDCQYMSTLCMWITQANLHAGKVKR